MAPNKGTDNDIGPGPGSSSQKTANATCRTESMTSLIIWNLSKTVLLNNKMQLKTALRAEQERLDSAGRNMQCVLPQGANERRLTCALLAWREMGHNDTDSLCDFIEKHLQETSKSEIKETKPQLVPTPASTGTDKILRKTREVLGDTTPKFTEDIEGFNFGDYMIGPVVRLPVENKIVMRLENATCNHQKSSKPPVDPKKIMNKIEAACCLETGCAEKLAKVEGTVKELRMRLASLGKREAERIELLERAEAAWKDLEMGYQRRLRAAEEKEQDLSQEIKKYVEERKGYREACSALASKLKGRGMDGEQERGKLVHLEQMVYDRACVRHRLNEELARLDTTLASYQCQLAQEERDLKFKEEQVKLKKTTLNGELESARAITYEAERILHAELSNLKANINNISAELLKKDEENKKIKEQIEVITNKRDRLIEDLKAAEAKSDAQVKDRLNVLRTKRAQLDEAKQKALECRCRLPVDTCVVAKRTPSLAAMCRCAPEDRLLESCSCSSLRTRLMNDLLSDLFGGLQSELGESGIQMPCQLLLCLQDNHNWDRSNPTKSNVESFFTKLLVSELEIAITNSIENYHAKWIGASCADQRLIPEPCDPCEAGWERRAVERRARQLAEQMAEQLYQQRADQLTKKAKDIVSSAVACQCQPKLAEAVFQCNIEPPTFINMKPPVSEEPLRMRSRVSDVPHGGSESSSRRTRVKPRAELDSRAAPTTPSQWQKAQHTCAMLQSQVEALQKETIKRQDLKVMEENIVKNLQRTWIGASCADQRLIPEPCDPCEAGWERRAVERRARQLAEQMAEQLYQQRADQLTKKAKDIVSSAVACQCQPKLAEAVFQCNIEPPTFINMKPPVSEEPLRMRSRVSDVPHGGSESSSRRTRVKPRAELDSRAAPTTPSQWQKAQHTCAMLQSQVEALQKETIKRQDLKVMEENIVKNLQRTEIIKKDDLRMLEENIVKNLQWLKSAENTDDSVLRKPLCSNNAAVTKKTPNSKRASEPLMKRKAICLNKATKTTSPSRLCHNDKQIDRIARSYAVNLCLCGDQKGFNKFQQGTVLNDSDQTSVDKNTAKLERTGSSLRQTKPITSLPSGEVQNAKGFKDKINELFCPSECVCFHKVPSGTSIDKLLDTLKRWKHDDTDELINDDALITKRLSNVTFSDDQTKVKDLCGNFCNKESKKNDVKKFKQPTPSESEYMGDVNLEKSYETCCTCINSKNEESLITQTQSVSCKVCTCTPAKENTEDEIPVKKKLPDVTTKEINTNTEFKSTKSKYCGMEKCHSEDASEFKVNFLGATVTDKISDRQMKDTATNVQKSLTGNCNCTTKLLDSSDKSDTELKNLEVNTFQLLEEHLNSKIADMNKNCDISCMPKEEVNLIFSSMLQKIKVVISDCVNEKPGCQCKGDSNKTSVSSWNRAYALLQEYLKTKLKKAECMCTTKKKETILPELLSKVCNMIESDFEKLKEICFCKVNSKYDAYDLRNKSSTDNNIPEKGPELEIGQCISELCVCEPHTSSKPVSIHCMVMQNVSAQVPLNLGMEDKLCDAACEYGSKILQTEIIQKNASVNLLLEKADFSCACGCSQNIPFLELYGHPKTMVYTYTDGERNNTDVAADVLNNVHFSPDNEYVDSEQLSQCITPRIPYLGFTVECSCDKNLGTCVCSKSLTQKGNDKMLDIFKTFASSKKYVDSKTSSLIKHYVRTDSECQSIFKSPLKLNAESGNYTGIDNNFCDSKISASCDEEIVLKKSRTSSKTTKMNNTLVGDSKDAFYDSIDDVQCLDKVSTKFPKNAYSVPKTLNSNSSNLIADNVSKPEQCDCSMVPICHIKMLIENIENKLAYSKCTCDSLNPDVCPVHRAKC